MTQLTKCLKCNGRGQFKSHVMGWGIATVSLAMQSVPLTCINCLGTGYACVPVKPKKPAK